MPTARVLSFVCSCIQHFRSLAEWRCALCGRTGLIAHPHSLLRRRGCLRRAPGALDVAGAAARLRLGGQLRRLLGATALRWTATDPVDALPVGRSWRGPGPGGPGLSTGQGSRGHAVEPRILRGNSQRCLRWAVSECTRIEMLEVSADGRRVNIFCSISSSAKPKIFPESGKKQILIHIFDFSGGYFSGFMARLNTVAITKDTWPVCFTNQEGGLSTIRIQPDGARLALSKLPDSSKYFW